MLGSFWIHHSKVACCQVSKDRNLLYVYSAAQMMNPLKFIALLGAALWLFAGANILRVVGDRSSQPGSIEGISVFVNFFNRLIWCSGTGYMLYLYPSHETKYEVHGLGTKIQHFTHLSNYSATEIQLQTILSLSPPVWELLGLKKKPEVGRPCVLAVAQLISWRTNYTYYSRDVAAL